MKTVIISDTHLTAKFNKNQFEYIKNAIGDADKVIINGDLWDGYEISFDRFVKSKWSKLFPLLKSKNTHYIFGNHDKEAWCDERVELFSVSTGYEAIVDMSGNRQVHISHGDFTLPKFKMVYEKSRFMLRLLTIPYNLIYFIEWGLAHSFAWDKEKFVFWESKRYTNRQLKSSIDLAKSPYAWHVFGHSHLPEVDPSYRFINSGFIMMGLGSHVEITDNNIELHKSKY